MERSGCRTEEELCVSCRQLEVLPIPSGDDFRVTMSAEEPAGPARRLLQQQQPLPVRATALKVSDERRLQHFGRCASAALAQGIGLPWAIAACVPRPPR